MGRWAQARKRGQGGDGSGSLILPPVYNTEWTYQLLDGGETIEVTMPDEPLVPPKFGCRVEHSDNGGAWALMGFALPGEATNLSGLLGLASLQIRVAWCNDDYARISGFCSPVDIPLGEA